jgi:two-component system, chemotaxis family, CheB/CheR fusion protein
LHISIKATDFRQTTCHSAQRLLRVLVIDNDPDTVDAESRLARLWGHEVRQAYSGQDGLEIAIAFRPDLLLLDIGMPTMDGCDMARRLRLDSRLHHCFIVAVTGFADEVSRDQCSAAGIDLLLIKPVDSVILESLLALEGDYVKRHHS